tara:strand:+ start:126 stop:257 length:132 start_codon:yes stop_codon:yes gene_type:complete
MNSGFSPREVLAAVARGPRQRKVCLRERRGKIFDEKLWISNEN